MTKNSKSQSFNYFIELNNQRQKVCKNAFIQLHRIKKKYTRIESAK
jgi:hypothetical protein